MTPELRQKYLLWLYQNPGQHDVDVLGETLGITKGQSAAIARYLIEENLAKGKTWAMIDDSWDGFLEIAPKGMKVIESGIPHNEIIRPVTNNTVVHGNNLGTISNVTATDRASVNISITAKQDASQLFQKLEGEVRDHVADNLSQTQLVAKLEELKQAYEEKDNPSILKRYQDFVGLASSHIELFGALAPTAIPALHALVSSIP